MDEEGTKQYIQHRLKVAEAKRQIFQPEAYKEIYLSSFGIPRQINNICDLALLAAYGSESDMINKETIVQVSEDLEGLFPPSSKSLEDERKV